MSSEVLTVLSLSAAGSLLALILLAVKPLYQRKLSKAFSYYIWVLVLLRLAVPVAAPINAMNALFDAVSQAVQAGSPAAAHEKPDAVQPQDPSAAAPGSEQAMLVPEGGAAQQAENQPPEGNANQSPGVQPAAPAAPAFSFSEVWSFIKANLIRIWAAGAAVSILWHAASYLIFVGKLRKANLRPARADMAVFRAMCKNRNVRLRCNPYAPTPMLTGVLRPCIVIPEFAYVRNGMEAELANILRHELMHHRRKDLVYKWMVVLITSLHWFNPLMGLLRKEISRACELACDEAVISGMTAREKQSYGNTLLALASKKRFPTGIPATTLCEEKEQLQERLLSIMEHKKQRAWAAVLSIILAACLAGCGAALGVATDEPKENMPVPGYGNAIPDAGGADAPEKTDANAGISGSEAALPVDDPAPAIVDFDGDGLEDALTTDTSKEGDGLATLTISLGNGKEVVEAFAGYWMPEASTGDLDRDGKDDIILHLLYWGGYAGPVHVFRMEDDRLIEFPSEIITNDSVAYDQRHLADITSPEPMGTEILQANGGNLLRLKYPIDLTANVKVASAWFVDYNWTGEAWRVEAANVGEAYGADFMDFAAPDPLPEPQLPTAHRDGFEKPALIFAPPVRHYFWAGDPDAQGYDVERNMMTLPARELAYIALQELYDMTGYQPEKCYVFCDGDSFCDSVSFSLYEDGKAFFSAYMDASAGYVEHMSIVWKQDGAEHSPIDPSACDLPENISAMTSGEIAQWFYENSTFGDRRAVASAESDGSWAKLTLENGDFYEFSMQENVGLPQNFHGPYPKGFTH